MEIPNRHWGISWKSWERLPYIKRLEIWCGSDSWVSRYLRELRLKWYKPRVGISCVLFDNKVPCGWIITVITIISYSNSKNTGIQTIWVNIFYLVHENYDFFYGLEADLEELTETHNYIPGSKDDVNLRGYYTA